MAEINPKRIGSLSAASLAKQILLPGVVLIVLLAASVAADHSFFSIGISNGVFYGGLPLWLNGATELVIITIGMALVTSASGGQDISVGVSAAISSAVFAAVLRGYGTVTWGSILVAILAAVGTGVLLGAFNGTLVAVFSVQPMVATLVLYTAGRSLAFLIDGKLSPILGYTQTDIIGNSIPGVLIKTPILIMALCLLVAAVFFKLTNIKIFSQTVGINEKAARLNGLDPVKIKMLVYVILGICCAIAGVVAVCKANRHDSGNLLKAYEMDAILAVAIGGNALGGGKFSLVGAIIGAFDIELLNRLLLKSIVIGQNALGEPIYFQIPTESIKIIKACIIILLMILSSPAVRETLFKRRKNGVSVAGGEKA